ncbi:MAG: hypothetical protein K9K88_01155 [Desulfobacterales bacterium]|nr:hypothetical protein [Desulfobacterales bacterium]
MAKRFFGYLAVSMMLAVLGPSAGAEAADLSSEEWYTERWCALAGGTMWVRMSDGGRCDCLTPTHAVEVAFASQWADAVGWSLRSAVGTGKKPGIVLIEEGAADAVHRLRLNEVIDRFGLPITVWSTSRGTTRP